MSCQVVHNEAHSGETLAIYKKYIISVSLSQFTGITVIYTLNHRIQQSLRSKGQWVEDDEATMRRRCWVVWCVTHMLKWLDPVYHVLSHTDAHAHTRAHHLKSVNQPNFTLLVLCSFQTGNVKSGNEECLLHTAKYIKASVERCLMGTRKVT